MAEIQQKIASNLYDGEADEVAALVQQGLDQGVAPDELLQGGLIAARAMHAGMDILRPLLADSDAMSMGKVLIGTVKGDLHDIGKNLVKMMVEGAGFETIDLGTDVEPQAFVDAVRQHQPDLVGMSALLTTTMVQMRTTIEALEEAGLRDSLKIMIGGAPVTATFAQEVGADAYAADAASAVDVARELAG